LDLNSFEIQEINAKKELKDFLTSNWKKVLLFFINYIVISALTSEYVSNYIIEANKTILIISYVIFLIFVPINIIAWLLIFNELVKGSKSNNLFLTSVSKFFKSIKTVFAFAIKILPYLLVIYIPVLIISYFLFSNVSNPREDYRVQIIMLFVNFVLFFLIYKFYLSFFISYFFDIYGFKATRLSASIFKNKLSKIFFQLFLFLAFINLIVGFLTLIIPNLNIAFILFYISSFFFTFFILLQNILFCKMITLKE